VFDGTNGAQVVAWLANVWPDSDLARMESGTLYYPNPAAPVADHPEQDWQPAPAGMLFAVCRVPGQVDYRHVPAARITDDFEEDLTP
jgi:hypothetical protein